MNKSTKYGKSFAPLRRVIKQRNFDISKTIEEFEDIEQFLGKIHEIAVSKAIERMKRN